MTSTEFDPSTATWSPAGYPRGPNGEKLPVEDFLIAYAWREEQERANSPLCECGWNGEEGTLHCVFCHETAQSEPNYAQTHPAHVHVQLPDGTYIRDRSQESMP